MLPAQGYHLFYMFFVMWKSLGLSVWNSIKKIDLSV